MLRYFYFFIAHNYFINGQITISNLFLIIEFVYILSLISTNMVCKQCLTFSNLEFLIITLYCFNHHGTWNSKDKSKC